MGLGDPAVETGRASVHLNAMFATGDFEAGTGSKRARVGSQEGGGGG